jgi:DNA-binding response OmpR family regulator
MTEALETNRRAPRVLIVEDDPSIVRFLANRGAQLGLEVEVATDGLQALVMVGRSRPDVLIVDVTLPKVDGLSLCACLVRNGVAGMPIIVISGYETPEILVHCNKIGASFAKKGPNLWADIEAAIAAAYPALASRPTEPDALRSAQRRFTHRKGTR